MSNSNADLSIDETAKDDFRNKVSEYLEIPEEIKRLQEPVKQLKARHKELEIEISDFMRKNELEQCRVSDDYGGGLLVLNTSTKKSGIKMANWEKGIDDFLRKRNIQGVSASDVIADVEKTREFDTVQVLKRIKR